MPLIVEIDEKVAYELDSLDDAQHMMRIIHSAKPVEPVHNWEYEEKPPHEYKYQTMRRNPAIRVELMRRSAMTEEEINQLTPKKSEVNHDDN